MDFGTILLALVLAPIVIPVVGFLLLGALLLLLWLFEHGIPQLCGAFYLVSTGMVQNNVGIVFFGCFLLWGLWAANAADKGHSS